MKPDLVLLGADGDVQRGLERHLLWLSGFGPVGEKDGRHLLVSCCHQGMKAAAEGG